MSYIFLPYDPDARFFDKKRIHPFIVTAHEIAICFEDYKFKSRKERKAIETILAVFISVQVNPILTNMRQTSNIQELISNLDDFYFSEWLKKAYLSPCDELLDGICELFHLKNRYSAYHKLVKSLKVISKYTSNQLCLYKFANNTEK